MSFSRIVVCAGLAAIVFSSSMRPASSSFLTPHCSSVRSEDATLLRARALEREQAGDLAGAREDWLAAAHALPIGAEREECVARASAVEARGIVRDEIRAAAPNDTRVYAELGIDQVDERGWILRGARVAWPEVPLDVLRKALSAARPSQRARVGLVHELLARGGAAEKKNALSDLARMVERNELPAREAWAVVARERNERMPAQGYVWQKNEWRPAVELAAEAHAAGLSELAVRFEESNAAQRGPLLASLDALGPAAAERTRAALETRWKRVAASLATGTTLAQLTTLAEARTKLDLARKHALDLIFDEQTYFYPYNPPECPPERAKLYAGVQQEVDTRVRAVRDLWGSTRPVNLSASFRDALEELEWSVALHKQRKVELAWPTALPKWIDGVDRELTTITLATFAWNAKERVELARDRAIEALNVRAWEQKQTDPAATADNDERRQVEITNAYRQLLGRRVLAWNAKIQIAAQGHSDYMSFTGDFGHFEPDPTRKTPADRLKLVGYTRGGSENCHMGGGAEGAHVGWTHSSGHHRNLLMPTHQEMASASAGPYWTQNFGAGKEFEAALAAQKPRVTAE